MQRGLFNITESRTTTLKAIRGGSGNIRSVSLTNTSSADVIVELFLQDRAEVKAYIVKTTIPSNVTLLLDDNLSFDNRVLSLFLTATGANLSTSTPLSVIIK